MSVPQEAKRLSPRMVVFVTRVEDERKLTRIFESVHIPIGYQCRGQGTAPSELMDILGFGGTTRLITMGMLPQFAVKDLFEKSQQEFDFYQRGGGIVLTIPITGLQSPVFHLLNEGPRDAMEQKIQERVEKDMAEVHEKSKYNLIWASVAAGYSDDVIDAARAAGAKGGTVLHGRRRNSEHVSQHFGISLQDEQDFVMIVVPKEKKREIMTAICNSCGLHTPARGTVLALPVDDVVGLEE
ncbi:MAG: transcriptional regulator [Clostridia bacterium]